MKSLLRNICAAFLVTASILLMWWPRPALASTYMGFDSAELQINSATDLDVEVLPPVYVNQDSDGDVPRFQKVKEQSVSEFTEDIALPEEVSASRIVKFVTVGGTDLNTYYYYPMEMPAELLDADGGRIRMIMQHETSSSDEVRTIDLTIGTEYVNNQFGARGRLRGRYGWTRQQGGGDYSWILGDGSRHNIANPWNWAWITDWRWLEDGREMGGNRIRLYSHPHVTTRFIFYDN